MVWQSRGSETETTKQLEGTLFRQKSRSTKAQRARKKKALADTSTPRTTLNANPAPKGGTIDALVGPWLYHSQVGLPFPPSPKEMKNLKREMIRAQEEIKRVQSVPLVIGQFSEMIDQNHGIVSSTAGQQGRMTVMGGKTNAAWCMIG